MAIHPFLPRAEGDARSPQRLRADGEAHLGAAELLVVLHGARDHQVIRVWLPDRVGQQAGVAERRLTHVLQHQLQARRQREEQQPDQHLNQQPGQQHAESDSGQAARPGLERPRPAWSG